MDNINKAYKTIFRTKKKSIEDNTNYGESDKHTLLKHKELIQIIKGENDKQSLQNEKVTNTNY